MNYEQASAVRKLAAPVNKVLERLEWECSKCQGKGYIVFGPALPDQTTCSVCKGEGKIPYSYSPQPGEWVVNPCVLNKSEPVLITSVDKIGFHYATENGEDFCSTQTYSKCIPILEWEEIDKVLEKAGYEILVATKKCGNDERCVSIEKLSSDNEGLLYLPVTCLCYGKSRQEAVMKAVIKLGKEMK